MCPFLATTFKAFKRSLITIFHDPNARANAGLPQDLDQTDHPTIIQKLREALQHLKYCQKSHVELRETYLHGLAEAIVLEKRPNLAKKDNSEALYRLTKDQVERLIKR